MKKLIYTFLCFMIVQFAFAQSPTITIKGKVIDLVKGTALDLASLSLQETITQKNIKNSLSTDSGTFKFDNLAVTSYKLFIGSVGYKTKVVEIKSEQGLQDLGTISLSPTISQLKEVTITGRKALVEQSDDKITYNAEADPASKSSSATDILRKTPFVTVDGDGNVQLNGQRNFKVLLNGKETALFAQNAKDALKAFPGSAIKKIEVITSPSAKYDAEGVGGIINIITQNKINGYNGSITSSYGTLGGYFNNASFNSKTGKFGISLFGSANGNSPIESTSLTETTPFGSALYTKRTLFGDKSSRALNFLGSLEISFDADTLNTFSIYGSLGNNRNKQILNQQVNTALANSVNDLSRLNSLSDTKNPSTGFGLDYSHKAKRNKEEEFSIRFNGQLSQNNNISNSSQYNDISNRFLINNNEANNKEFTMQADYLLPFKNGNRLELGVKSIFRKAASDYESLIRNNDNDPFIINPTNTDKFNYTQQVYSAYASYKLKINKYSLQLGARLENTNVNGNFISSATVVNQNYTNIIPNLMFSRKWNNSLTSTLNYNIRLQRPFITSLNPYINNIDPLNISYGNPDLTVQNFHNLSLQTRYTDGKYFAILSLFGSISDNTIAQFANFNPSTGVTTITNGNTGKEQQASLTLNLGANFTKNFNLWTGGKIFYNKVENKINSTKYEGFSGGLYLSYYYGFLSRFNLTGYAGLNKGTYTLLGPGMVYGSYQMNLGFELIKDKLSGSVNFNNFLQSNRNLVSYVQNPNFQTVNTNTSPYRVTYLVLTYRIGKLKENVSKKKGVKNDDLLEQ